MKLIIVNMACGLANRMFQYAYYRMLLNRGWRAQVDYFTSAKLAHEEVAWDRIFPDAGFEQASAWDVIRLGGHNDLVSKAIRKFMPRLSRVSEMPEAFSLYAPESHDGDRYLLGVFQNVESVEEVRKELQEAFRFSDFEPGRNADLANRFAQEESVAIHVRKGKDYQQRIWYRNTCPSDYYEKAVAEMKRTLDNPRFYVFTDNPEWVGENLKNFEYTLVEGNPVAGWGSHFDMQLMSLCRHNIISNSTYSWWSAFLNANEDKKVIMPEIWFNPESTRNYTSDMLRCGKWMQL